MKKYLGVLLFIYLFISLAESIFAQTPFIRNFSSMEYKAATQNWAVLEDQRGLMYFGNTNGILEYDGSNWRLIKTPSTVRSLAMDKQGRIYVGLVGDIGYLKPNQKGSLRYQSLKEKIPKAHLQFNEVWFTNIFEGKAFFMAFEKSFMLQEDTIAVFTPEDRFHTSFVVNDQLYIREWGRGLLQYENGVFQLVSGGEQFAEERIYAMLPYEKDRIIIGTRTKGIYLFAPKETKPNVFYKPKKFEQVDSFLVGNQFYQGIKLPNEEYAMSTITGGFIIFNKKGQIKQLYNKENGLQDDAVWSLYFSSRNNSIWVAMNDGIGMIPKDLPFEYFGIEDGLDGAILAINKFQKSLYVSTSQNLFLSNPRQDFMPVKGTKSQNWNLHQANGQLLVGISPQGVFEIKNNISYLIKGTENLEAVIFSDIQNYPNELLVGLGNGKGLMILEFINNQWKFKQAIKGFNKSIYGLVQDENGYFWAFSSRILYKVYLSQKRDSVLSFQNCLEKQFNLNSEYGIPYKLRNQEVVFGTDKGISRYLEKKNKFIPHPDFTMLTGRVSPFVEDSLGNIWFEESFEDGQHEKGVLKKENGQYKMIKTPFLKFKDEEIIMDAQKGIFPESEDLVYFGTNKGLLKYYPQKAVNYNTSFHTIIRKIMVNDTLFYDGTPKVDLPATEALAYENNNLTFFYTANFFEDAEKNQFSYRLIGRDSNWSDWQKDTKKEYTNLVEGNYVFEVKSKNIYRKEGIIASFTFRIFPPWYRTLWAYLLYGLASSLLVWLLVQLNAARLIRINLELEQKVESRTKELREEKEITEKQNQELEKLNHIKDQLFAIIGHDLRKPVLAFRGISKKVNYLIQQKQFERLNQLGESLEQSALNLNKLLDNLLKWALSQKNAIKISSKPLNVEPIIEDIMDLFAQVIFEKQIHFKVSIEPGATVLGDRDIISTIMRNLIDNALKFTPSGKQINFSVVSKNNQIVCQLKDFGVGMTKTQLEKLFQLDKDKSSRGTAGEKGTGLGMVLVKDLVELQQGEINVDSQLNQGTLIEVSLPAG